MYEILKEAAPQAPALVVLVILVFAFLGFLRFAFKAIRDMVDNTTDIAKSCAAVIKENSKIQGQVLEALHRTNGRTTLEAVKNKDGQ